MFKKASAFSAAVYLCILCAFLGAASGKQVSADAKSKAVSASDHEQAELNAAKYPTVYNGVDLSLIYDYTFYMKKYSYLRKKFGNDPAGAIKYFGQHGIRKGQQAKKSYSAKTYRWLKNKTHPYPAADEILDQCGWELKKAFVYASKIRYYNGSELGAYSSPWNKTSKWYFDFGRKNGKGNCYVKSGTFAILAKEMGYKVTQAGGLVPYRSGNAGPHSWAEIIVNKTVYVFDPSYYHSRGIGYKFKYGTKGTYKYMNIHYLKLS